MEFSTYWTVGLDESRIEKRFASFKIGESSSEEEKAYLKELRYYIRDGIFKSVGLCD